jgi:AcrR family transcriptional regulator
MVSRAGVAPRQPRLPAEVRREQILEAATIVFARVGFREGSTAAIAAELGVSEPMLFRHFRSKRDMYLAALDRVERVMIAHWTEIASAAPSPLAALIGIGQWYLAALQEDSRHLRLRFRACADSHDPDVGNRVRDNLRGVFQFVLRLLEAARDADEIDRDADLRAHAWVMTAIGTLVDVTQIMRLRDELPLEELPKLLLIATPTPARRIGPSPPAGRRRRPPMRTAKKRRRA